MKDINDSLMEYEYMVHRVIRRYFPKEKKDEDVIQAGMIGLWKALKSEMAEEVENFEGFAAKCIKGEIIRELSKNINRKPYSFDIDISSLDDSHNSASYTAREADDIDTTSIMIKEYLSGLSERSKQIYSMKYNGKTIREIAIALNVSVGLVSGELKQIKKDIYNICF
jgi:RNA polymerase sporulation-specific sigma factor